MENEAPIGFRKHRKCIQCVCCRYLNESIPNALSTVIIAIDFFGEPVFYTVCTSIGVNLGKILGGTWRARPARAYSGSLRAEPSVGSRGKAPGQGVRGAKPP